LQGPLCCRGARKRGGGRGQGGAARQQRALSPPLPQPPWCIQHTNTRDLLSLLQAHCSTCQLDGGHKGTGGCWEARRQQDASRHWRLGAVAGGVTGECCKHAVADANGGVQGKRMLRACLLLWLMVNLGVLVQKQA